MIYPIRDPSQPLCEAFARLFLLHFEQITPPPPVSHLAKVRLHSAIGCNRAYTRPLVKHINTRSSSTSRRQAGRLEMNTLCPPE
jgi:hypothetical protein